MFDGGFSVKLARMARKFSHPDWVLITCILASSLSFVDGSVTNVALPAIGKALGGGAADLQWVINAYLLPLSALLLIGGAAGDRFAMVSPSIRRVTQSPTVGGRFSPLVAAPTPLGPKHRRNTEH